jgi:hypothetical protein
MRTSELFVKNFLIALKRPPAPVHLGDEAEAKGVVT